VLDYTESMGIATNLMAGFGAVMAIQVVMVITNVGSSYLLKNGQTLQELLTSKVGGVA
jgi:hypothetical protein